MARGHEGDPAAPDAGRTSWTEPQIRCHGAAGSGSEARQYLDAVIHGMSRRRARELRLLVDRLDNAN
ncbi:hypothetical protein ACXNSR_32540 [Streptomyces sp. NC-S4]